MRHTRAAAAALLAAVLLLGAAADVRASADAAPQAAAAGPKPLEYVAFEGEGASTAARRPGRVLLSA